MKKHIYCKLRWKERVNYSIDVSSEKPWYIPVWLYQLYWTHKDHICDNNIKYMFYNWSGIRERHHCSKCNNLTLTKDR